MALTDPTVSALRKFSRAALRAYRRSGDPGFLAERVKAEKELAAMPQPEAQSPIVPAGAKAGYESYMRRKYSDEISRKRRLAAALRRSTQPAYGATPEDEEDQSGVFYGTTNPAMADNVSLDTKSPLRRALNKLTGTPGGSEAFKVAMAEGATPTEDEMKNVTAVDQPPTVVERIKGAISGWQNPTAPAPAPAPTGPSLTEAETQQGYALVPKGGVTPKDMELVGMRSGSYLYAPPSAVYGSTPSASPAPSLEEQRAAYQTRMQPTTPAPSTEPRWKQYQFNVPLPKTAQAPKPVQPVGPPKSAIDMSTPAILARAQQRYASQQPQYSMNDVNRAASQMRMNAAETQQLGMGVVPDRFASKFQTYQDILNRNMRPVRRR